MSNRLDLDFSIDSAEDRVSFIEKYLQRPDFIAKPLTQSEHENITKYLMSGKNSNGKTIVQEGYVELDTKYKTWDAKKVESLDALVESPTFHEPIYMDSPVQYRAPREVFSREDTRKSAPPSLLNAYEALWRRIDETELLINLYELRVGKRTQDPRSTLKEKFTENEYATLNEKAQSLSQYEYLKLRHLLVELRREQYTLKDGYIETLRLNSIEPQIQVDPIQMDVDIPVLPIGLCYPNSLSDKVFPDMYPTPGIFTETDLQQVLQQYWSKKHLQFNGARYFSFEELEHVYEAFQLMDQFDGDDLFSTSPYFLRTLNWYVARASLSESQREILDLKIKKMHNQDIADFINKKYQKSYTANYISTIFRQKIIPAINEAARLHAEIIENLPYPENFKECRCCGKTLLLSADNFVRKARSADGFNSQCKRCDSEERARRKSTTTTYKEMKA